MSYSGFTEYLCAAGHHSAVDCWEDWKSECWCGAAMTYYHCVDTTNGIDSRYGGTSHAKKCEIGFTDTWHDDHYGNRYARKHPIYEPRGKQWLRMSKGRMAERKPDYFYEHVDGTIHRKPSIVVDMGGGPHEYFASPFVKRWWQDNGKPKPLNKEPKP